MARPVPKKGSFIARRSERHFFHYATDLDAEIEAELEEEEEEIASVCTYHGKENSSVAKADDAMAGSLHVGLHVLKKGKCHKLQGNAPRRSERHFLDFAAEIDAGIDAEIEAELLREELAR